MSAHPIKKTVRGSATWAGDARIVYTWPCGHRRMTDHSQGPVIKRFGAQAARFLVRYWTGSGGVHLPPCRRCARKAVAGG